jgi:hypothetical protein
MAAWGDSFDVTHLPARQQKLLANTAVARCGRLVLDGASETDYQWQTLPRSIEEPGGVDLAYTPAPEVEQHVVAALRAALTAGVGAGRARLLPIWSRLVTRCLSARKFDLGRGVFFDDEMVMMYGAEHALEGLLSRGGAAAPSRRTVCPDNNHGDMFFAYVPVIANMAAEIEAELSRGDSAAPVASHAQALGDNNDTAIEVRV